MCLLYNLKWFFQFVTMSFFIMFFMWRKIIHTFRKSKSRNCLVEETLAWPSKPYCENSALSPSSLSLWNIMWSCDKFSVFWCVMFHGAFGSIRSFNVFQISHCLNEGLVVEQWMKNESSHTPRSNIAWECCIQWMAIPSIRDGQSDKKGDINCCSKGSNQHFL